MPPQQGGESGFEVPHTQAPSPEQGRSKYSTKTSKYARRRKTQPELELEEELFGNEKGRKVSRGKWDTSHLVLFTIFSLLLGLALGVILARALDSPPEDEESPAVGSTTPPPATTPQASPPATTPTGGKPPATEKTLDPALEPLNWASKGMRMSARISLSKSNLTTPMVEQDPPE